MSGPRTNDAVQGAAQPGEGIDLVLFDYGQVLSLPPDPVAWAKMQAISGLVDAQLHEAYWRFRHDYDRDALSGRAYWQKLAQHTGILLTQSQVEALLAADIDLWTRPNRPMIAWAGRLQRAQMRTAVLSNIGDAMAKGIASRLDWLKGFERCIWSYALKLAKPDPAIFRRAIALLNILPERILFLDDKQENVAAAAEAGMRALRYSTQELFEVEMREHGYGALLSLGHGA